MSEISAMDNMNWYKVHPSQLVAPPQVDRRKYNLYAFRWCNAEYTPIQVVEHFEDYLPFLMMTTQGFLGRDEWINAVASDEVYWLKEIARQPRIVVKSETNDYYSIPLNYPQKVIPLRYGEIDGGATTINKLVESDDHTEFCFALEENQTKLEVFHDAGEGISVQFGRLEIVDRYSEKFLVVHSLSGGHLFPESTVIPIYMPVAMTIAVGLARADHKDFLLTMLNMKKYIDSVPKPLAYPRMLKETSDILMYEEKPKDGIYDRLQPARYVTLGHVSGRESSAYTQLSSTNLDPNIPDILPRSNHTPSFHVHQQSYKPVTVKKKKQKKQSKSKGKHEDTSKQSTDPAPSCQTQADGKSPQGTLISERNQMQMSKLGYHVDEIHPIEMLELMRYTLDTGIIPEKFDLPEFQWTDSDDGEPEFLRNQRIFHRLMKGYDPPDMYDSAILQNDPPASPNDMTRKAPRRAPPPLPGTASQPPSALRAPPPPPETFLQSPSVPRTPPPPPETFLQPPSALRSPPPPPPGASSQPPSLRAPRQPPETRPKPLPGSAESDKQIRFQQLVRQLESAGPGLLKKTDGNVYTSQPGRTPATYDTLLDPEPQSPTHALNHATQLVFIPTYDAIPDPPQLTSRKTTGPDSIHNRNPVCQVQGIPTMYDDITSNLMLQKPILPSRAKQPGMSADISSASTPPVPPPRTTQPSLSFCDTSPTQKPSHVYQNTAGSAGSSTTRPRTTSLKSTPSDIRSSISIPADIRPLDIKSIGRCLSLLNLEKYKKKFQEAQVDGELLYAMDADILHEDFGLKKSEALKLVKFTKEGWRPVLEKTSNDSIHFV